MRLCRLFASIAFGLFVLTACNPSSDKPAAPGTATSTPASSAAATAPSTAPAANQPPAPVQASEQNGGQYTMLATPQPTEDSSGKTEVLEFFGYFCNHCHALDPALNAWVKKQSNRIAFKRIPVRPDEGKLYYALEAMGKLDALHEKIFNAVQVERKRVHNESAAADLVAQFGVDRNAFIEQYNSFSVQSKVMAAANTAKAYGIDGVPMVAIDGRFITSGSHAAKRPGTEQTEAGLYKSMLAIMDELLAKARQERGAGAKAATK
ncbi:MAG: dsbA [Burkholderiaceae bacterium]|nr:dsbA [Burkholderiaceae bacterium]